MEKVFKDVPNYEGSYKVSNCGEVLSVERIVVIRNDGRKKTVPSRILKPSKNNNGYKQVVLCNKGKNVTYQIHMLVAMAFLGHVPCGSKTIVDHKDNNNQNNHLNNLQLITHRKNTSKDKKGFTSKYVGVSWCKQRNKWNTRLYYNGKNLNLGIFSSEEEASLVYQNKLKELSDVRK